MRSFAVCSSHPVRPDVLDHIERQGFPVTRDDAIVSGNETILLVQADTVLDDPFTRLKGTADALARGISLPPCATAAAGIVLVSQPGQVLKGQKAVQRGKSKKKPDPAVMRAENKIFQQLLYSMTQWDFSHAARAA